MRCDQRLRRRRRGAATVEFAFCIPVLLTVIFAVIEFSRLLQIQHAAREAALEGARTGMTLDGTTSTAQSKATSVLAATGITNATVAVTDTATGNALTYTSPSVSATVSVDPSGSSWFIKFLTAGNLITASVVLDREVKAISVPGP